MDDADVLTLDHFAKAFTHEDAYMNELVDRSNSSPINKVASFATEHPEVLAPLSLALSSVVANSGGAFYKAINKEKIANDDRRKFLGDLCSLNGYPYAKLNWAKALRINHFLSWFMPIFKERLNVLMELRELDKSDMVVERVSLYELVVQELDQLILRINDIIRSYEKASDAERVSYKSYADQSRREFAEEVEGVDTDIKKNELKLKGLLISESDFKSNQSVLSKTREDIVKKYYCQAHGCDEMASSNSSFCFEHKCKEPGCSQKTFSTPTDMGQVFINQGLGFLAKKIGNENTSNFLETGEKFCQRHNADINIKEIEWSERYHNSETVKIALTKDEQPPSSGKIILVILAVIAVIIIIVSLMALRIANLG